MSHAKLAESAEVNGKKRQKNISRKGAKPAKVNGKIKERSISRGGARLREEHSRQRRKLR
jgi:hypothetical protein